jgi:hypothetical protein
MKSTIFRGVMPCGPVDVSEEHTAFTFRVEVLANQVSSEKNAGDRRLFFSWAYSSTLKTEATHSHET